MNRKALSKLGTFVMVVIIISMIFLIGSSIISRFLQSNNNQAFTLMVNKLNTEIDLMLNENAGATKRITLTPPSSIHKLCFFDYSVDIIIVTDEVPDSIVNRANSILNSDASPKNNLFVLLNNEDVRFFYVGAITVPTINESANSEKPYCLNTSPKMELKLTSKGKKVLIE